MNIRSYMLPVACPYCDRTPCICHTRCPECGDVDLDNFANEGAPIKDCLDHTEDGDVREIARREIDYWKKTAEDLRKAIDQLERLMKEYKEL